MSERSSWASSGSRSSTSLLYSPHASQCVTSSRRSSSHRARSTRVAGRAACGPSHPASWRTAVKRSARCDGAESRSASSRNHALAKLRACCVSSRSSRPHSSRRRSVVSGGACRSVDIVAAVAQHARKKAASAARYARSVSDADGTNASATLPTIETGPLARKARATARSAAWIGAVVAGAGASISASPHHRASSASVSVRAAVTGWAPTSAVNARAEDKLWPKRSCRECSASESAGRCRAIASVRAFS